MTTLVIAPHPDDESISCGGLIAKVSPLDPVFVLAIHGRKYPGSEQDQEASDACEVEDFTNALRKLGADGMCLTRAEGEPQQHGFYSLLTSIEEKLADLHPTRVIIPSEADLNQDHRHLSHVCKIALRPTNLGSVKQVLEFHGLDGSLRKPTYFVPLAHNELVLKIGAINCYRRERRGIPSPRAPWNVVAQSRVWGAACGHEFAEGYTVHLWRD